MREIEQEMLVSPLAVTCDGGGTCCRVCLVAGGYVRRHSPEDFHALSMFQDNKKIERRQNERIQKKFNRTEVLLRMNNVNLQMIVPKRCKEMLRASKKLKGLLIESGEEPHMLPEFMPLLLCATVSCIAEHLNVTDMETLLDILDASDCFDITPLEEGKFVITLVFSDIFEECEVM